MDNSPLESFLKGSKCSKIVTQGTSSTMSPITNLAQGFSFLSAKSSVTPCRKINYSDPSPTITLAGEISCGDSPFSDDSPTFQEGILKGMQESKSRKGRFFRPFQKLFKNTVCQDDKENVPENEISNVKQKSCSQLSDNMEDSVDDHPGASQESGFGDYRSFASQSSFPSVRSSVFTDEELDEDEDSLFAVDKFVEDEALSETLSSSMTQLIKGPLLNSYDEFKYKVTSSLESDRTTKSKSLRRCLSMVVKREDRLFVGSENWKVSNKIEEEDDETDNEAKFSSKLAFKRPEPVDHGITPLQSKRRKSSPVVNVPLSVRNKNQSSLVRCYSETAATIMKAVQKSVQHPDLIGDCSKPFALPLIDGRHQDLKAINGETLVKLINGDYHDSVNDFLVVDCRYPYEFDGGHIKGAKNIYTKNEIYNKFLQDVQLSENSEKRSVIVFHCEFSSERAPKLLRFLRNKDRELNEDVYPRLHHPEMYILEGGYKAFFQEYEEFCEPSEYKPMLHKDHSEELKEYQREGKSRDSKGWGKLRETQHRILKLRKLES